MNWGFYQTLKLLRSLVFVIGVLLLAGSIYLTVDAWPQKPVIDVKVFWFAVNFTFLIFFIFSLIKAIPYRPHLAIQTPKIKKVLSEEEKAVMVEWRSIRKKALSGDTDLMKLAIMEADKLAGEILERVGFTGETTGDKINQILSDDLGWIRSPALKANEYRNHIVHTPDFEITREGVKKAIHNYEVMLQELDVIDLAEL
ncbi:MAG: hypothetical protein HY093_00725 [Candidatus Liptonbacteria bacterium]|nr:hypothetical protein [Candidatus Liptonbacteria bacterium]